MHDNADNLTLFQSEEKPSEHTIRLFADFDLFIQNECGFCSLFPVIDKRVNVVRIIDAVTVQILITVAVRPIMDLEFAFRTGAYLLRKLRIIGVAFSVELFSAVVTDHGKVVLVFAVVPLDNADRRLRVV